jgi:hypothetical protein
MGMDAPAPTPAGGRARQAAVSACGPDTGGDVLIGGVLRCPPGHRVQGGGAIGTDTNGSTITASLSLENIILREPHPSRTSG